MVFKMTRSWLEIFFAEDVSDRAKNDSFRECVCVCVCVTCVCVGGVGVLQATS